MKIEQTTVRKLVIKDVPRLDPITVILEDIAPKQGKIIIECYGESWSAYWGGMGDNTISEFFTSVSVQYIANRMFVGQKYEPNFEGMKGKAVKEVLEARRKRLATHEEARELYDEVQYEFPESMDEAWHAKYALMQSIFGDDWYCTVPKVPTDKYQYLQRIVTATQSALKQLADDASAAQHATAAKRQGDE